MVGIQQKLILMSTIVSFNLETLYLEPGYLGVSNPYISISPSFDFKLGVFIHHLSKEVINISFFSFKTFEEDRVRRESFPFIKSLPETVEIATDSTPNFDDRPLSDTADSSNNSSSTIFIIKGYGELKIE